LIYLFNNNICSVIKLSICELKGSLKFKLLTQLTDGSAISLFHSLT